MIREELIDSLKRQADKIDELADETDMRKQDILDLKKEAKNKVSRFDFDHTVEGIGETIQTLEETLTKIAAAGMGVGTSKISVPIAKLRKQRSVMVGEKSHPMIEKFKELSELVEIMNERQKKLD